METYIVTLVTTDGNYEVSAVVIAVDEEEAVKIAIEECSFEVLRSEVDCERICDEEPCIHWLT